MAGAQDLGIELRFTANSDEARAAIQAILDAMGDLPDGARSASDGAKSAFQSFRDDLNAAFTFSLGALMADGLKSGLDAIKQFGADSVAVALEFEQVMTGVAKTTGLPAPEIDKLGVSLRAIAADIGPIMAADIGQIAEVAGQLGIASESINAGNFAAARTEIEGFATVIAQASIALPEFTGGAEEVATVIAKQIALYQQDSTAAEQFLSVMNALANTTAANAAEISNFLSAFTLAPQLNITQEQAAALGATFVSLGQDANDAGTRLQAAITAMLNLSGDKLVLFENVLKNSTTAMQQLAAQAGVTSDDITDVAGVFQQAMANDAVGAIEAVITAMADIEDPVARAKTATNVFGLVGARVMSTLIGNTGQLTTNLKNAAQAAEENISIQEEFQTAISTNGAKFEELKSKVADVKIEVGQHLTAALSQAAAADISPAIDQFREWLATSQDAKTLFESLPIVIGGLSTAAVGAGKLVVGAYSAIIEAANWWGDALVEIEIQLRNVVKAIDDTVAKAKELTNAVFQNEQAIGLFQKVTDKILGVPPAIEEATAAQEDLTQSIQEGIDALSVFGDVAYGGSVYPDTTNAILDTKEAQRGLTEEVAVTTEQVNVLGQQAVASFSEFASAMKGIGSNLGSLGSSLGDLGGILGIKELGGLSGILGKAEEIAGIPSILGEIGGSLGGLLGSAGSLGGILGGGGLTGAISGLTGALSGGLGGAISTVSGAIGGLGSTILGGLGSAVSSVTGIFGGLGGAATGLLGALGPIGLAGGAIALAWKPLSGLFKSIFGEAQSEGNKANEVWRNYVGNVIDSSGQMEQALTNAYKTFSASGNDYMTFLNNAGPATRALHDELGGLDGVTLSGLVSAMEAAGVSSEKSAQVALQQVAAFAELGMSAEEARDKIAEMIDVTEGAGEEGKNTSNIFDQTTDSIASMSGELDTLSGDLAGVTGQLSGTGKEGASTTGIFDRATGAAEGLQHRTDDLSDSLDGVTRQLSGTGTTTSSTSGLFVQAGHTADDLGSKTDHLSSGLSSLSRYLSGSASDAGRLTDAMYAAARAAATLDDELVGHSVVPSLGKLYDVSRKSAGALEEEMDVMQGMSAATRDFDSAVQRANALSVHPGDVLPQLQARVAQLRLDSSSQGATIGQILIQNTFDSVSAENLERLTDEMNRRLTQKIRRAL